MSQLKPPRHFVNPDEVIPLSPPVRPPFVHYVSSGLPPTPHTPYSPLPPSSRYATTPLRPYLSLFPRILLTFCSPCLLPMILTIAHLIQNRSSTASLAASLRSSLLSACTGLAKGAASIKAIPRYLAMQTNEEAIKATQASILAIGTMLIDAVTIIEVVVNFIVDTYRSMLLCTIELAVRGTLEIVISAVQTISDSITDTLNSVRADIQDDISSANTVIQDAVSAINTVTNVINVNLTVPSFTVPSLSFLENVTIPTSFEDTLLTLNSSLPTLSDLKEKMDEIIDIPFEALIAEINSTRLEMAASFNSSILPVPSLSSLSASSASDLSDELCSDLDTSLIDDTANALHKLSTVAIGLMFFILFAVWAALAIWEWHKWRVMKKTVEAVEEEWAREGKSDAWRMVAVVEHPMLENYSGRVLDRMGAAPRTRTNLRWFLSYLAHPTCLALLSIALLGFLSIQFQLIALDAIKSNAESNANATVTASATSLATKLSQAATNSSAEYANAYNEAIVEYQDRINNELFGSWVNTTAVTLNTTLVEFYAEVEKALNATFGGTILYNPVNTFIYCIVGSKITTLEEGLTWISEHAFVDLPTLSSDILMLSNDTMSEITTPIVAAAVGSSSDDDDDDGLVSTLIEHFESALKVERTFYGIMLGVWLGLFLIGLAIVLWHSGGKEKFMEWRGVPPAGPDEWGSDEKKTQPKWKAWLTNEHPIYNNYAKEEFRGKTLANAPLGNSHEDADDKYWGGDEKEQSFLSVPQQTRALSHSPSTVRSTIASLAAPGQTFLKLAGRKVSGSSAPHDADYYDMKPLVNGDSSEKYFHDHPQASFPRSSSVEPARPRSLHAFWVDKFYGTFTGVKSMFPTRGQRLGASLKRTTSSATENSFGASRVPTARTPGYDWGKEDFGPVEQVKIIDEREAGWSLADTRSIGRALDGDPGRYPPVLAPSDMTKRIYDPEPAYPRRMSRAPTLREGLSIPSSRGMDPFQDAPPLPSKDNHDSIDYLYEYDSEHDSSIRYDDPQQNIMSVTSPTSSSKSYFEADPQLVSASKVHLGAGQSSCRATLALANVMKELEEKKQREDPFGDAHSSRL